jgi:multidrug efflux pump
MVQLDNFVTLQESTAPPQLYRYNRFVAATVSAGLAQGITISQGLEEMDKIAARVLDDSSGQPWQVIQRILWKVLPA